MRGRAREAGAPAPGVSASVRPDQIRKAITPSTPTPTINESEWGIFTILIPERIRTKPKAIRSARSGTRIERCEPIRTPGIDPTSSQAIACRSTFPCSRLLAPATQSSSAAWSMSVPTIRAAESGKSKSMARPKKVPEPTDVRPTMKPKTAPIRIANKRSRRARSKRASTLCPRRNVFARNPKPPTISVTPTILLIVDIVLPENELAIWTPTSDIGAEPTSIHMARGTCTLPSCRCRTAPKDLKTAPCRMSVPTAVFGSKPKSRISIGVINEPPPIPVMPTSTPIIRPAMLNCQVMRAGATGRRRTAARAAGSRACTPRSRCRNRCTPRAAPAPRRGCRGRRRAAPRPAAYATDAAVSTTSPTMLAARGGRESSSAPSPKRGWITSK